LKSHRCKCGIARYAPVGEKEQERDGYEIAQHRCTIPKRICLVPRDWKKKWVGNVLSRLHLLNTPSETNAFVSVSIGEKK